MDFNKVLGWKAEVLRFSLFTSVPTSPQPDWWQDFTGTSPEETGSKPSTGEFSYIGNYDSGILELRLLPDRIDWFFRPDVEFSPFFPSIGEFREKLNVFKSDLLRWLSNQPGNFSRIAFGVTILDQVNCIEDGYSDINDFLPFLPLKNSNWQDFNLQFNKIGKIPNDVNLEVDCNRIVNYSTVQVQSVTFNGSFVAKTDYFTRLNFDINTRIENAKTYEKEDVLALFDGLTDITKTLKDLSEV